MLSWVRSLTALAPFSIVADMCNLVALAIVFRDDWETVGSPDGARPFAGLSQLAPVFGVAVYCFEGFPMTLPLEASMKNRDDFPWVLGSSMAFVACLYAVFGMAGYMAYGEATRDIITLNLPAGPSTALVKLGLCVTLFFTFPVMMFPVHGIIESEVVFCRWFQNHVQPSPRLRTLVLNFFRAILVMAVLMVAAAVPGFGVFIQLVGSSVCSLLGFVMPAAFYMQVAWDDMSRFSILMHSLIIVFGILFGVWGTWDALSDIKGGVPAGN
ncbi:hypothetical protein CBR_g57875 [Chara braunii]|uniref:Amino acid transporter transmembrane domain-containing protein n=1 Tax=Chara braunii TaxID=69332 RepID=A0A388K895_CHABU|nr:hypothetical protein CBR_g57875 [Chara braunii]|eukprot:GBG66277.1 hypothetical protein CBR_g57875 [Chara braunii]